MAHFDPMTGLYVITTFSWLYMAVFRKAFAPDAPAWQGWVLPDEPVFNAAVEQVASLKNMEGALRPEEAAGAYMNGDRQDQLLDMLPKQDVVGGVPVNLAIQQLLEVGSRMATEACDRLNAQLHQQQQERLQQPHQPQRASTHPNVHLPETGSAPPPAHTAPAPRPLPREGTCLHL